MNEDENLYGNLLFSLQQHTTNTHDKKQIKKRITNFYRGESKKLSCDAFLNLGLKDNQVECELIKSKVPFFDSINKLDLYSPNLSFYLIRPLIQRGVANGTVLDIGCGNGIGTRLSSFLLKAKCTFGIDITPELLLNAKAHTLQHEHIHYLNADCEELPFADNSINVITNLESAHLYPDPEAFYHEVFRVLKPGGYFCYADFKVRTKACEMILNSMIKKNRHLKVEVKQNITGKVQAAIYHRVIKNEEKLYQFFSDSYRGDKEWMNYYFATFVAAAGAYILPWYKKRFKNKTCNKYFKSYKLTHYKHWLCKRYYYYLIQMR